MSARKLHFQFSCAYLTFPKNINIRPVTILYVSGGFTFEIRTLTTMARRCSSRRTRKTIAWASIHQRVGLSKKRPINSTDLDVFDHRTSSDVRRCDSNPLTFKTSTSFLRLESWHHSQAQFLEAFSEQLKVSARTSTWTDTGQCWTSWKTTGSTQRSFLRCMSHVSPCDGHRAYADLVGEQIFTLNLTVFATVSISKEYS